MYEEKPLTGSDLPLKTLCLTYDDGPGKDTFEIAKFLYEQNVRATFFVVGKYAIHHSETLERVSSLGHLIGNHTYEHPDMPYYLSEDGDVINQVLRTDAIIKKYVDSKTIFFRSPYGKWAREVANELNLNLLSSINHVGPINWDVGGVDCLYWKNGKSIEETLQRYLQDIHEVNKGIVVMHDEIADMEYLKKENRTLELTKQLIPLLKRQGYQFVRLDEISSINKKACEVLKFTLQSANGKFLFLSPEDNSTVKIGAAKNGNLKQLGLLDLQNGKIALSASNGLFLSMKEDDCSIKAISKEVKEHESFDLIPISQNRLALRAFNGNYLMKDNKSSGRLIAGAEFMRGAEIFTYSPINARVKAITGLNKRHKNIIRKVEYIKSKIEQKFLK
jgi:peptidoglycan/xylan/chitin deacetylase (PgdA/CDA1 family)